jgi:hypothetical protein
MIHLRFQQLVMVEEKHNLLKNLPWTNLTSTHDFWLEVHNFVDGDGKSRLLRTLSDGVLRLLCVPIFDAAIDKRMRQMRTFRQENRARMSPSLMEAAIFCRDGLARANADSTGFNLPVRWLTGS